MTADYFYMDVGTDCVDISIQDGRMKAEAEVYVGDLAYALINTNDNLDMLAKPIKDELIHRAENAWDENAITDEEWENFQKVLEMIL